MNNSRIASAIIMATQAHDGILDRLGKPSILHPLRVGAMGKTEDEQIVGFLHDTLEDTQLKMQAIHNEFGATIAHAVQLLTRSREETYKNYLIGLKENRNLLGITVKINDLLDNLKPERISQLPTENQKSLTKRYREALAFLRDEPEDVF
jgi:(p)ppGpp synthase/HD superfamily hydrolase